MAGQPATKLVLQKFFSIFVFAVGEEGKSFSLFAPSCIYRVTPLLSGLEWGHSVPHRSSEQLSGQCASTIGRRAVAGDTVGADGQNWRVSSLAVTSNSREWASGGLRRVSLGAAENTEDGSLLTRRWGWLWAQDGASWFSVIHCQNRNFRVPVAWDLHR